MDIQLHMPFWAILYCGFIFANGVLTIIIAQNDNLFYKICQLLSAAFAISFFFVYYEIVEKPDNTILTLMLFFILFQEVLVNRKLYDRLIFSQIAENEKNIVIASMGITLFIFLLPFIYVVVKVFNF